MSQGRKNIYRCNTCLRIIVTLDIDEGTTPFMLQCYATKGCRGLMYSQMYMCDQQLPHGYEWYKPASLEGFDKWTVEHIEKGGLVLRTREGEDLWKNLSFNGGKPRKKHRRHDHTAGKDGARE